MKPPLHTHSRPRLRFTWCLLPLTLLLCACFCSDCNDHEESQELAHLERGEHTLVVHYSRTRKRMKNHPDQLFKDSEPSTAELIALKVTGISSAFTIASSRNKEDRIELDTSSVTLDADSSASRIAYRLDDGPWELLYRIDDTLIHAPKDALMGPPRWEDTPTFEQNLLPLYLAHRGGESRYSTRHRAHILSHLVQTQGQRTLADFLITLATLDEPISEFPIREGANLLEDDEHKRYFINALKDIYMSQKRNDAGFLSLLLSYMPANDQLFEADLWEIVQRLNALDKSGFNSAATTLSNFLMEAARKDLTRGQQAACDVLTTHPEEFTVAQPGRRLRLTALTIIARSKKACARVPDLITDQPCKQGFIDPDTGKLYTLDAITPLIDKEFAEGPIDAAYTRTEADGRFVLGAFLMTGQPIPEVLSSLSCPAPKTQSSP